MIHTLSIQRNVQSIIHQAYLHIAKQNSLLMILFVLAENVVIGWGTQIMLVQRLLLRISFNYQPFLSGNNFHVE